jgi:DNA recombination protein RmuC
MIETLLIIGFFLLVTAIVMLMVLLRRSTAIDLSPVVTRLETLEKFQERTERSVKEEISRNRQESAEQARGLREEVQGSLKDFTDSLQKQTNDMAGLQKQQFDSFAAQLTRLTESNEKKSDDLRATVEGRLKELQADNAAKLEEMRRTVDEKLQGTLDKRLGESFKLVSDRLEQVHKGLGEMQTLANGVGDLKRVLTNVKTRGTWGETQLGNLLDDILTPDQYARNVLTKPTSREAVEFALKLPGRDEQDGKVVWLPIDAKFPKEDYERLVDAAERGDPAAVEQAAKDLESRVRSQARDIRDKYLAPPHTTDFGLLYLPTEGLYAEVLRRPGLADSVQREQRVVIVGPTTLAALLNSLQMGFRTLAIQKRSSEVWKVLGAVKTEFGKFGDILDKVKKKLDETGNTIEEAAHRSRQLEKKLRKVEALPSAEASALLADVQAADTESESAGEEIGNGLPGVQQHNNT